MRALVVLSLALAVSLAAAGCAEFAQEPAAVRRVLPTWPLPTPTPSPDPTPMPVETPTVEVPTLAPTPTQLPTPTPYPWPDRPLTYYSNIGPFLLSAPVVGNPTHNLLKDGNMRAYMAINPAHWGVDDALPEMEGYGRNFMAAEEELAFIRRREQGARGYYERFRTTYEQGRGRIHAWMSTWAFEFGDPAFAEDWVAFQREWLRLMHADGHLAGIGGMKAHRFAPGEITALAPAIAEADYLFLAESGAPTLTASMGVTTLVYRGLVAELRGVLGEGAVPPLILDVNIDGQVLADIGAPGGPHTKRGYRDFGLTPEQYAADLRNYDIATLHDEYVKHVFWFATNITEETLSFDVNTPMLAIADGWHIPPQ